MPVALLAEANNSKNECLVRHVFHVNARTTLVINNEPHDLFHEKVFEEMIRQVTRAARSHTTSSRTIVSSLEA